MDLVDLNKISGFPTPEYRRRDPYGSRGSKSSFWGETLSCLCVEILMDLVDLNSDSVIFNKFKLLVEILMDLVDLNMWC